MKPLTIILFIVLIIEAYLTIDARKQMNFYSNALTSTRDNYINRDILNIKINIKIAEEMNTNPANASKIINDVICSGNPFPDMFLNTESVALETRAKMQAVKEEVAAHCKK